MKKSMILFGLMMVSTIMFAQRRMEPMERAAKQAEKMKTELGLDEVQYKAVKAINEDHARKSTKIWRDSTLSKEARQQQMKAFHTEKEAALQKVLTEAQRKKLAENRADQRSKHGARMARDHGDYADRMKKELSLSDDQTEKVKAINREFGQKFRTLRSDSTISKDDNKNRMKQLRDEHQKTLKSVLTEEQSDKWEKMKSEHKRRKT